MKNVDMMPRAPRLSLREFQDLQRIFNSAAGLAFDDSALPLFERRLASRLPLYDLGSFHDYARLLQFGAQAEVELAAALDLLTTGETYFFRHEEQLAVLSQTILPALATANAASRRLSIWSAGCSSGEEAYTLAILLVESRLFDGWSVNILATDLSQERIEHARQGCYFQGAFRCTDERIRRTYFQESGRIWQVRDDLRRLCRFAPLNLLARHHDALVGRMDLILCRNVLIYLDERARARVIDTVYGRLTPGGYLLLGHSEALDSVRSAPGLINLGQHMAFKRPLRQLRGGSEA